ncbi:unnamed protein product [Paramecium pentaurelia]|uniref:Uncharacterized protein n=1 Tax=Paramecium pentaurelia TaxID=43138 RepID=A0A8S1SXW8_9CILI|nr:unnamed protein product [Paramecium pentaurelia]
MIILFLINYVVAQILYCDVKVDGIEKGQLTFQLQCDSTPQSCLNIQELQDFKLSHISEQKMEITNPIINKKWKSEINNLYTQFGAIGQQRNIESGEVDQTYTIFLNKQEFDGPKSQWLVIGNIIRQEDKELLNYLKWTSQSSNQIPNRDIKFKCSL